MSRKTRKTNKGLGLGLACLLLLATPTAALADGLPDEAVATAVTATANQQDADEWYVLNFITLDRQDPAPEAGGSGEPIDIVLTITYDNEVLARLDKEFTSRDKYTQVRVSTAGDYLWIDPNTIVREGSTALSYTFALEDGQEAALWIVEDLHRDAKQANLELKAIVPSGCELGATEQGKFHSSLERIRENDWFLPDATVEEDYTSKEGIPNARLALQVAAPTTPPDGESPSSEDVPPFGGGGGDGTLTPPPANGMTTSTHDGKGISQLGDAVVPIGAALIIGSLVLIAIVKHKRDEG